MIISVTGVRLESDFTLKLDSWIHINGRQVLVDELNIWKEPDGSINAYAFRNGANVVPINFRPAQAGFGQHGNAISRDELIKIICKWHQDLTVNQVNRIDTFYPGFAEFYRPRIER